MITTDTIMLFTAGKGTRMYPLTLDTPKPLVQVLGRPILYWVLDHICLYPFKKIIINTHYLASQIEEAVNKYVKGKLNLPQIIISYEEELLETGGGLKNNLKYCNSELIFSMNSDSIIITDENPFQKMLNSWDDSKMDILMLLHPTQDVVGYSGQGDLFINDDNSIYGIDQKCPKPFMNAGIHLIRKKIVQEQPEKIFSLKKFYMDARYNKRLYGVNSKKHWLHATCPEDIVAIENYLRKTLKHLG
jgi:N-acetyl-alpha-D-muramate 1-phosphate uridylyltransferase